jgi:hypothetical protein
VRREEKIEKEKKIESSLSGHTRSFSFSSTLKFSILKLPPTGPTALTHAKQELPSLSSIWPPAAKYDGINPS